MLLHVSAPFLLLWSIQMGFCGRFSCFKGITIKEIECGITKFSTSCSNGRWNRIVGGFRVKAKEIPWQSLIFIGKNNNFSQCGGSLISKTFVLSAAHCFFSKNLRDFVSPEEVNIYFGYVLGGIKTKYSQKASIKEIIPHSLYNNSDLYADIALLKLKEPVFYSKGVSPICLPTNFTRFINKTAIVSGYGETKYNLKTKNIQLHRTTVTVLENDNEYCLKSTKTKKSSEPFICGYTLHSRVYFGDSGGPLTTMVNKRCVLLGILSYRDDYPTPKYLGIYTKVLSYNLWIQENLMEDTS